MGGGPGEGGGTPSHGEFLDCGRGVFGAQEVLLHPELLRLPEDEVADPLPRASVCTWPT